MPATRLTQKLPFPMNINIHLSHTQRERKLDGTSREGERGSKSKGFWFPGSFWGYLKKNKNRARVLKREGNDLGFLSIFIITLSFVSFTFIISFDPMLVSLNSILPFCLRWHNS